MPMSTRIAALAATALLFTACSSDDDKKADPALRQNVLTALTTEVMVPAYQDVAARASALVSSIEASCATPADAGSLTTAQEAWSSARGAWLATRAFRFGPATTLRTMSTIDFPIDGSKIDALLAGAEVLTEDSVKALGSDQRGLGGIEYALFADEHPDERGCSYLQAASQLVADTSAAVLAAWTDSTFSGPPFADQLQHPGQGGGMYAAESEAYEDLINSMIFAIADVADARIGRASGDVTGTPEPQQVDGGRAHRARQDAIDVVTGTKALYDGSVDGSGVRDVVAAISDETAKAMDANFSAALAALDAIPSPLSAVTDPAPVHAAYEALKAAQVTLRAEIASQLGVTLTFGDADGDS
jgi:predicted lipoprotein